MSSRILLFSLLLTGTLLAQTVPQHKRLLYSDSLTSAAPARMGSKINVNGEFIAGRGWKISGQYSQLTIALPADLPPEGTFVINVTNFDPASQSVDEKQNLLTMASDDSIYWLPQYETGSWWLYRTGKGYTDGPGMAGFRIDYAPTGVDTRSDGRAMQSTKWSLNKTYEFKVVWQANWISFYVDNVLIMDPKISKTPWSGQKEFFRYILIGRNSKNYPAQPGPIWSNARIYVPGPALVMSRISGDGQSAYANTSLTEPLVIKITDDTGAVQAGQPVVFSFTQGSGQFIETQPVLTDAAGLATVHVKLGATAGACTIQAACEGASNSPVIFSATATNPAIGLRKISGDTQSGPAGAVLPEDIVVKAVYKDGSPVPNEPVLFQTVDGGTVNGSTALTLTTDAVGQVSVQWTLGTLAGACRLRAAHGDSAVEFSATATPSATQTLALVSGGGQTGTPGQLLPAPVIVRVHDEYNNPVAGQSVLFAVTTGGGKLQGQSNTSVLTGADGQAAAQWTMGPYRGVTQHLQVSSTRSGVPLSGSPLTVEAGLGAPPDAALSTITATSPVIANGSEASTILVTVRDGSGTPLSGYLVRLAVSGTGNKLTLPDSLTNAAGQVTATLKSTAAGSKIISARVIGADILLSSTASVLFNPVPQTATSITMISGNNQSGTVGEPLSLPLIVRVINDKNAPANNYPVDFQITSGSATLETQTTLTVMTDAEGLARAPVTLGTTAGTITIGARTAPLTTVIVFTAHAKSGTAHRLSALSGFSQSGAPGKVLTNPLVVAVTDLYNNPVSGYPLKFQVVSGGGSVGGTSQVIIATDALGTASAYWTLGRYLGALNQMVVSSAEGENGLTGSPLLMEITRPALPDITQSTISATSPVIADGAAFSDITVTLLDAGGRPLSGYTIDLSVTGFNNLLTCTDSLSNPYGQVKAKLGSTSAESKVVSAAVKGAGFSLSDTARVQFTPPAQLDQLVYVSGDGQTGRIGALLPQPVVVRVLDYKNRPKGGVYVDFTITEGGGVVNRRTACSVFSDSAGNCQVLWTLGPAAGRRNNSLSARLRLAVQTPLTFTASAAASEPARWSIVSGDRQSGTVCQTLAQPFCIQLHDLNGNEIADYPILFKVMQGDGSFSGSAEWATKTNAMGQAAALLTLGKQAVTHQVQAFAANTPLEALLFNALALPEASFSLHKVSADSQMVPLSLQDPVDLIVRLTDRYGNPITGRRVDISAPDGGSVLSQPGLLSDARGEALFRVKPGSQPGVYHFNCQADNGTETLWSLIVYKEVVNHPPVIAGFVPADTSLTLVTIGTLLDFHFAAIDEDGDSLHFQWLINNNLIGTQPLLSLVVNPTLSFKSDGTFTVTGRVSDAGPGVAVSWRFRMDLTGVEERQTERLPEHIELAQNYPNPFNSATTLLLALPERTAASLQIYSLSGQKVTNLFEGELAAGTHRFIWDGRTYRGEPVPSGIYYGVLEAGGIRQTRKIVLMR
jgi:adhesin/invasin